MNRFARYFTLTTLGYLLFGPEMTASQSTCKALKSGEADFICGNIPEPYQPCHPHFKLIQGQATTQTSKWFLGEFHSDRAITNHCLDILTKDIKAHTVYVESAESGVEVDCQKKSINAKPGRRCVGWDNLVEKEKIEHLSMAGQEWYPKIVENIRKILKIDKPSSDDMDIFLIQQLHKLHQEEKAIEEKMSNEMRMVRARIRTYKLFLDLRDQGISYKNIFKNKMYSSLFTSTDAEMKTYKAIQKNRNKSLVSTFFKSREPEFAAYVTGLSHLDDIDPPNDPAVSQYVKDELSKTKHQNYFAVLAMI